MANVLECSDLKVRFGRVRALDGVDLALPAGSVMGVLGPNGAGKTTLIRTVLGLARADAGSVAVFGAAPGSLDARVRIGTMMQVSGVPMHLRVRELLELFTSYYPRPMAVSRVLELAGVAELSERFYGKLSGGQQRRVQFALAICGDPELICLDEPTVGMDVAARRAFRAQIRELAGAGRTILLTTHYLEEADALADDIAVLARGRILARGAPDDIKGRVANRRIRCSTRMDNDRLRMLPGSVRVDRSGQRVEVLSVRPDETLRALLDADATASDIEVTGAGLEEAFLSLTDSLTTEEAA